METMKEVTKDTHRGLKPSAWSSSSQPRIESRTKARQSGFATVFRMARMFPRQRAELRTFMRELFVPEIQRTKNPFPFSKGKQEVVHNGPNKLTHSAE